MFNLYMVVYVALLFFALTPGVLLRLPPKGSKMVVTLTHAAVFAVILSLTCKKVSAITNQMSEGFRLAKRSRAAYMTGVPQPGGAGAGAAGGIPVPGAPPTMGGATMVAPPMAPPTM
jgi:hypothetical protein